MRRTLYRALAYGSLLVPLLACGSGGGGGACLGWVQDDQGGRHSPQNGVSDRARAQEFACNIYCAEADPMFDARYRIWLDSPRGNPAWSRMRASTEDPGLLDYVLEVCAPACVADVASGQRPGGVDCSE